MLMERLTVLFILIFSCSVNKADPVSVTVVTAGAAYSFMSWLAESVGRACMKGIKCGLEAIVDSEMTLAADVFSGGLYAATLGLELGGVAIPIVWNGAKLVGVTLNDTVMTAMRKRQIYGERRREIKRVTKEIKRNEIFKVIAWLDTNKETLKEHFEMPFALIESGIKAKNNETLDMIIRYTRKIFLQDVAHFQLFCGLLVDEKLSPRYLRAAIKSKKKYGKNALVVDWWIDAFFSKLFTFNPIQFKAYLALFFEINPFPEENGILKNLKIKGDSDSQDETIRFHSHIFLNMPLFYALKYPQDDRYKQMAGDCKDPKIVEYYLELTQFIVLIKNPGTVGMVNAIDYTVDWIYEHFLSFHNEGIRDLLIEGDHLRLFKLLTYKEKGGFEGRKDIENMKASLEECKTQCSPRIYSWLLMSLAKRGVDIHDQGPESDKCELISFLHKVALQLSTPTPPIRFTETCAEMAIKVKTINFPCDLEPKGHLAKYLFISQVLEYSFGITRDDIDISAIMYKYLKLPADQIIHKAIRKYCKAHRAWPVARIILKKDLKDKTAKRAKSRMERSTQGRLQYKENKRKVIKKKRLQALFQLINVDHFHEFRIAFELSQRQSLIDKEDIAIMLKYAQGHESEKTQKYLIEIGEKK